MPPREPRGKKGVAGIADQAVDFFKRFAASEAEDYAALFKGVLGPWLSAFATNAAPRIRAAAALGLPCEATATDEQGHRKSCPQAAAGKCEACARPVCLAHCFLTWRGDAVCWECVNHTIQSMRLEPPQRQGASPFGPGWQRPPGGQPGHGVPPPGRGQEDQAKAQKMRDEIARSLQILGLGQGASWDEVNRAFRFFVANNHPDKAPADMRGASEERFKTVSAAFNFLKSVNYGQQRATALWKTCSSSRSCPASRQASRHTSRRGC